MPRAPIAQDIGSCFPVGGSLRHPGSVAGYPPFPRTLQGSALHYQALLAKYDFKNCIKLAEFKDHLPPEQHQQAPVRPGDCRLVAMVGLQVSVDAAETASSSLVTGGILHHQPWLRSLRFQGGPDSLRGLAVGDPNTV